ncbi:hypothetical protein [Sphingomonas solaris]|uniref:Uncharacterized protein n=1 Tax=Alterirhizorhabdus solaris TaxID=2529389 RepID=A0A558RB23_9SPHN|nr:hypothetical protein [Sphingomonas solaris]TVV76605.1 hypothetical protein FOY91_03480 [Sphingomonas solaris]
MNRVFLAAVLAFVATPALALPTVAPMRGEMLRSVTAARLAPVYRVAVDGSPQIIIAGRLVTIPVATVSALDGRLRTSLSRREVTALQ